MVIPSLWLKRHPLRQQMPQLRDISDASVDSKASSEETNSTRTPSSVVTERVNNQAKAPPVSSAASKMPAGTSNPKKVNRQKARKADNLTESESTASSTRRARSLRKRRALTLKAKAGLATSSVKRARVKRNHAPAASTQNQVQAVAKPPPPPPQVPNYNVAFQRAPRMSVEVADTYEEYDGTQVNVDAFMDSKQWQVEKLLDKEVREDDQVYYLCKWEDTWETYGMYRALKYYKHYGYQVKIQARQKVPHGGHMVEMILCRWQPQWERQENIEASLVANYEQQMTAATTDRATETMDPEGDDSIAPNPAAEVVPESPAENPTLPMQDDSRGSQNNDDDKEVVDEQEEIADEKSPEKRVLQDSDDDDSNCSSIGVVADNDLTEEQQEEVDKCFAQIMANIHGG